MKTALLIFLLVIVGLLFVIYLRPSSKEPEGKKIALINTPDSLVILYEGVIVKSESENFSGSSFLSCRYKMENDRISDITVITPMAIAMNMRIGDTIYFQRTSVSSLSQHGTHHTTFIGAFYDTESLREPKHIQRFKE
ncbi:MAG: hypothetical protein WC099_00270 [Candidatus Paceibacterota bacterium]